MYDMQEKMVACNYCGSLSVFRHQHYKNRCVDCGKLYDRYKKALRHGIQSEIALCGGQLLQRGKHASVELQKTFYRPIADTMKQLKEEQSMTITHKICKQCGRDLPISEFRKYTPRGTGVYKTTQGHHTLCKNCEAISVRAANALSNGDTAAIEMLRKHYALLQEHGFEPATAPARKLLGVDDIPRTRQRKDLASMLSVSQEAITGDSFTGESELGRHCRLVRQRGYANFDEADAAHRRLAAELPRLGPDVYEEINNLMDDWYMEG